MASEGGGDGPVEQHSVFQTRRLLQVIELPLENSDDTNVILSFASRCVAKKQFQAFYCADKTLLLRSLEEDLHPRFWRLPWTTALDRMQQQQQQSSSLLKLPVDGGATSQSVASAQHVVALEFAPDGDWLVVIVSWGLRTFLLLVPVASLVTRQRKVSLQNHLRDGASEDLMSVTPSAMSTKMMSFLRAHGQNGAKYHSNVAGDDEDVSVLEFAQGMSSPTCVAWWRSFNGHNYVLLGSSADLISIVHVETNNECCRCELSGKIKRIELVHTASTTAMLVETAKADGATWHFKVLLEMKKPTGVKTFPDHFLEDTAFRPVRIKQFAPTASLHVVRDSDDAASAASTPLLAVSDANAIRFYSNDFKWTPVTACALPPSLHPSTDKPNVVVSFCSSQLMLVQVGGDSFNLAVWVSHRPHIPRTDGSQPSKSTDGQDGMSEGKVVHTLKLREDERVRHTQNGRAIGSTTKEDGTPTMAFFLHTDHQVYECRPKWTRALLFHALYARTIHVEEAVFIGYALGIDMASLCEAVADSICADHTTKKMSRNSCEWIMRLYAKSAHVMPSTTLEKMVHHGGLVNAIEYAKEALAPKTPSVGGPVDKDRQFLAHTVIESTLKLHHQATKASAKDWAWFVSFLSTNADFDTAFAIARCALFQCIDAALAIGHARRDVDAALRAVQDLGATLTEAQVDLLLSQHHASNLTAPEARILFRSLPLSVQIKVLLRHPSAVWLQRDWVLRILPDLSDDECASLAAALDPRTVASTAVSSVPYYVPQSDVATSEAIPVTMEEKVELFLTLLLRLNCQRCRSVHKKTNKANAVHTFNQDDLVSLIKAWSKQYRPPVLVLRCVDYTNWAAAAACYEAQGEWVDAIECKLHLHDLQPKPGHDDAHRHVITHEELVHLMDTLVFSSVKMAAAMRVAVLARLFMHWHLMKYDIEALEAHVVKQSDLAPVATILFTKPASFDQRDRGWIEQCQAVLPFSGRFYFDVCQRHVRQSQRPTSDPAADKSVVDTVLENIQRHHTDLRHVTIQRQTPAALGQTDPIETHAAVFSCGHGFPKRVFDDDVVPLFEKKMAIEFPTIPHTTAILLAEYRKGGAATTMEAPCPVCAFSRIQRIFATANQSSKLTREPPRPRIMTSDQWVWK